MTKFSPFLIQKCIQGIVGTPNSVQKLRTGALLIEVTKKQSSTALLDLKLLANTSVIGKAHNKLNQSKAILLTEITTRMLCEQEMKSELESQVVISVKRFPPPPPPKLS